MSLWRWFRARRGWVQLLLGIVVVPLAAALLYVAGRSLQYAGAEKDAGPYVPSTANVVVRARDLEKQLARIQDSVAWRAFDRKILRDGVLRREFNGMLQAAGAPTLDDLEDERKPIAKNKDRVLHAIGADVVGSLQVKGAVSTARFCAIVRLRWLHYLATPFARLALPTENVGGETCLLVRNGAKEIRVAFVGALAIASDDKALLEQALRRQGLGVEGERPIEARVVFEGSPGLLQVRKALKDGGLFPYVNWETVRGLSASGDVQDAAMVFDAAFDRAQPLRASAPPVIARSWAPLPTTGVMITNTGGEDLIAWLRTLMVPGSRDPLTQNLQDALNTLDGAGLSSKVLPLLQDGLAVMTGVEERSGVSVPTLTLILPAKDPAEAVEALNALVKKIAGTWGNSQYFTTEPLGVTTVYSWRWPEKTLPIATLAAPTYGSLKGMVVIGSNREMTIQLIRTAEQADGFEQTSQYRKLRTRLKEMGFSSEPSLASGFLFPPQFRESLSGSLIHIAKLTMPPVNGAALRAEVEAELRRQGRPLTDAEIVPMFNDIVKRQVEEEEARLRRALGPLDTFRWGAFEASTTPKGISVRAALEFR
jgi:hypothetical protein